MSSTDEIAIVSEDWSPWLLMAPRIITSLGECIARASTKEASQVSLGGNLPYRDLASNLVAVANQGQNAFLETYGDMLQIGSRTNALGQMNGHLDRIAELFGNPAAQRSVNRLLDRVKNDILVCNKNGSKTAANFTAWHQSVGSLHAELVSAQSTTASQVTGVERQMLGLSINSQRLQVDMEDAQARVTIAEEKHRDAVAYQRQREEQLNSAAATVGGAVGVAVATGVSTYLSTAAAGKVAKARAEKDEILTTQRDIKSTLMNVEIDLRYFETEKKGLEHLIVATTRVLEMLAGLTENIMALLSFFKRMNVTIEEIINENESALSKIAEDAASGIELNEFDIEDFHRSTRTMKKLSLSVHALSALYAGVITDIINPGFALVTQISHYQEGNTLDVVGAKQEKIAGYLKGAEEKVKETSQEANRSLIARCNEVDRTEVPKPSNSRNKSSSPRNGSIYSQKSTGSKKSFFSFVQSHS